MWKKLKPDHQEDNKYHSQTSDSSQKPLVRSRQESHQAMKQQAWLCSLTLELKMPSISVQNKQIHKNRNTKRQKEKSSTIMHQS